MIYEMGWFLYDLTHENVNAKIAEQKPTIFEIIDWWFEATLREKCPNMEIFLVHILMCSEWIQENTDQKKVRIWTLFMQC